MASNNRHEIQNQLQRSGHGNVADIRHLASLKNLGNLVMHHGPNAIPLSSSYLQTPMNSPNIHNCGHPSLPVRRNPISSYGRMGIGMGYGYSPYSRYPTNMYTPGYGGFRMPSYGQYGGGPPESSSFIQMAEESTRPAFESIESVVEVVSSISMMLESTYHAVHSSYSAILGVVDQFSRLKDHLAQMLSILALIRGLRWLCLKFLYLLRLRKDNPSDEAAWSSAEISAGLANLPPRPDKARGSAWPFLMFVSLVIGAPWLMFKLLSKTVAKKPLDTRAFQDEHGRHVMATTAFDFKATQADELSFSAGEKLYISPASSYRCPQGWLYACNSNQETGLIPSTYLALKPKNGPMPIRNGPFQQVPHGPHMVRVPNQQFDSSRNAPERFNEGFDYPRNPVVNSNYLPNNFDHSQNLVVNSNAQPNNFDYSKNPVENSNAPPSHFDHSKNPIVNFNAPPNNFDYSKNPVVNSHAPPSHFDHSKNPVENSIVHPSNFDYSRNAGEKFDARSDSCDYSKNPADQINEDFNYSKNSVGNSNTWPSGFDYSTNVGEQFYPNPNTRDHSKNPLGTFNPQQGAPNNSKSAKNFNSQLEERDYSQNAGDKGNAPAVASDYSKNSTKEIQIQQNDNLPEEVAKNPNNTTET